MAINEIDPLTRTRREHFEPLNIIRVGTSGLLQADSTLGTSIISNCAVGLDNTGLFYDLPLHNGRAEVIEQQVDQMIVSIMSSKQRFYKKIHAYATFPDSSLLEALIQSARELGHSYDVGMTVSSSGFSANQGRAVGRISPSVPDIDRHLSELPALSPLGRYLNMEMEASFLFHFATGHGYRAGAVCAGIANRRFDSFAHDTSQAISNASAIALRALNHLRTSFERP
jgi:uridine phosphorylase